MRDRLLNVALGATVVLCAVALVLLTVLATEPRSDATTSPTPEEIAQLRADKNAARDRADALARFDALAAIAGIVLGSSAAALAVRLAGPSHPARPLVALGAVIGIVGPIVTWTAFWALGGRNPPVPPEISALPQVGVALAAAGCLVGAGALRPTGSVARGLAMGAVLYAAAGVTSLFAVNALSGNMVARLPAILADPVAFYVLVLWWPLRIAATLDLFGLTFG